MRLAKALGEEPRRLVPQGIDVSGTVLDSSMKPHGGSIVLPVPVVTYTGREKIFGRSEQPGYDYTVATPKYWTRKVLVPWIENFMVVAGRPVLSMPLFRADNVIRVANRFRNEEASAVDVQTSVNRYHDEVERALTSKRGLLTRDMFGVRCCCSLRAVVVPDPDLMYHQFGIPKAAAAQAGIKENDWILALRSPVLWHGSVLVARAKLVDGAAAQSNPFVMQGLGLDFDGDQMSFFKIDLDHHPHLLTELTKAVGDPTVETFKWADEFLINDTEEEVNWNHIGMELLCRLAPTGMSLGPEDCLDPSKSPFLEAASKAKETPKNFQAYAQGLKIKEWAEETEAAAVQVCKLKLEVGLLGASTDKMNQVLLAFEPELLKLGLEIKERLTDLMMKNAKRRGGLVYDTNKITALLDRRGPFESASVETAMSYMEEVGFDINRYRPVIELLYDFNGATEAVRNHMPLQQSCRTKDRAALVRLIAGEWGHSSIASRIYEYTEEVHGAENIISYPRLRVAGAPSSDAGRLLRDGLCST